MQVWVMTHYWLTFLLALASLYVIMVGFKSIGGAYAPRVHHCDCDCDEDDE